MISCVDKSSWRTLYLFGLIRRCLCLTWSTWSTAVWTLDDMDGHLFQAVTLNKMNSIQKLWTNKKLADLWCLQAWLAFVSSSKKLEWNSLEVYLEVSCTIFKLQLKPPLTIPDPYYLFLSPSENFWLHEVLNEVLTVVLFDVHLEVLTSPDYTRVISTHPNS